MRALLGTDVVIDVVLARAPVAKDATVLLDLCERGMFEDYVSAITPVNISYIARKAHDGARLRQVIGRLLRAVRVCPVDHAALLRALHAPIADYEGAVQHACAEASRLGAVVTRNLADYKNAAVPVHSPAAFLERLASQQP
jgi:predicted nucleic acid-binding protein